MEQLLFLFAGSLLTGIGFWLNWYLREREQYVQYKTASVEKRLECHQRAFALTYDIQKAASKDKHENVFNKCHQWWSENNFYLEPRSRNAFQECYWQLLLFRKDTEEEQVLEKRINFTNSVIPLTRRIISEEIGIPYLDEQGENGN